MHVTIIKSDNTVGIDGEFLPINCSALAANFHALQWDGPDNGVDGYGEIEWDGKPKPPNTEITDLGVYYAYVEAWRIKKSLEEAKTASVNGG
jgi:hypothetical protein